MNLTDVRQAGDAAYVLLIANVSVVVEPCVFQVLVCLTRTAAVLRPGAYRL